MTALFELSLSPRSKSHNISDALYQQLKAAIVDGRLKPGLRLPATRSAPALFGVARNTAQGIYDRLCNEGLVTAHHGSGTYVADPMPPSGKKRSYGKVDSSDLRLNPFWVGDEASSWIGFWRERRDVSRVGTEQIELRPALVDPTLFPQATFRQVMARQLRRLETRPRSFKSPQGNQGNFQLRNAISDHVALTRAVGCSADDVVVTAGAQQAFDLIARALVKPGQTIVAVEDPGYPPMRVPFAAAGAQLVPVKVDSNGIVVSDIPREARIICVCPSHQFPLGMSMSPIRRRELLQFAQLTGAVIVEDDYDGEFRYEGSPIEALRTTEAAEQVFYIGSFSKCMLPSLRLGFVVAPDWARATLIAIKNALDWHCPVPLQAAVAEFIAKGHLGRHVRRLRRIYQQRRDHLLAELTNKLDVQLRPIRSSYGMHVAALADDGIDCEAVSGRLAARGIEMHALDRYFLGPMTHRGFVFGFASSGTSDLSRAVDVFSECLLRRDAGEALQ